MCSGIRTGGLCVQGSCSTHHIHLQHPCDSCRHTFGASETRGTHICCLREFQRRWQMGIPAPGHLRSARGLYLLLANSSCGLCCRPAWSWCVVVLMNVAITYIFKSFFFYVFLKFSLDIKKKKRKRQ